MYMMMMEVMLHLMMNDGGDAAPDDDGGDAAPK